MHKGTLIKSTNFHTTPYWVVLCDNNSLIGNRKGELPIDEYSFNKYQKGLFLSTTQFRPLSEGMRVNFEIIKLGELVECMWYAKIV